MLAGMILIAIAVSTLAFFGLSYLLSSTSKYGTRGHTASEFKIGVFFAVTLTATLWAGFVLPPPDANAALVQAAAVSAVAWGAALVGFGFTLGRSLIKFAEILKRK